MIKFLFLLLLSVNSFADFIGNSACVCSKGNKVTQVTSHALNYGEELKLSIDKHVDEDFEIILYKKIIKLSNDKSLFNEVELELKNIKSKMIFEKGNFDLGLVNNYAKMVCTSKFGNNCKVEQIANYTNDSYSIIESKFSVMSKIDKAAFILQQIFYNLDRKHTETFKADWSQEITAKLFSENSNNETIIFEINKHFLLNYKEAEGITNFSLMNYFKEIADKKTVLSLNKVKFLLLSGADINETYLNYNLLTFFISHLTPKIDEFETFTHVFNILLNKGAEVKYGDNSFVSILVEKHDDIITHSVSRDWTLLSYYYENLFFIYLNSNQYTAECININYTGPAKLDPISWMIWGFKQRNKVIKEFVSKNFNQTLKCDGKTPLHYAVELRLSSLWQAHSSIDNEMIRKFLEAGFSCREKDGDGKTPYDKILSSGHEKDEKQVLINLFKAHNCDKRTFIKQTQ